MSLVPRRLRHSVAAVLAVGLAFSAGAVAGGTGESTADPGEGIMAEAAAAIAKSAVGPVDREELEMAAVRGMLDALDDRWAHYYTPDDYARFQDSLDGRYSGVGLWVRQSDEGEMLISSVLPASAADEAGLRAGDVVLAVDGVSASTLGVARAVSSLRGDPGTEATITVRSGTTRRSVPLRRDSLASSAVRVEQITPAITRVGIAAFTREVGRQVRTAVAAAAAAADTGVILDLRGNPGGLLDQAVETASRFLDGGPVVSYQRRGKPPRQLNAPGDGNTTIPLVVLVDGGTASAAEVVAAALQDRDRAVIVGSRTFGKGSVQESVRLSNGSAVKLTVARYRTPSGRSLEGVGLAPDIEVAESAPSHAAVARAVDVLTGLLADARNGARNGARTGARTGAGSG